MSKLITLKTVNEKMDRVMEKLREVESFNTPIRDQVNNFAVRLVQLERGRKFWPVKCPPQKTLADYSTKELADEIAERLEDSE